MTRSLTVNDCFPNLVGDTQHTTNFDLYEYLGDSWGLIYCHPGDFTPICTTELGSISLKIQEFDRRNIKICGFSCNDSISHQNWIEDIEVATGGHLQIPLFCDPYRHHAVSLGILDSTHRDDCGLPMTVRSVYVLKPDKTINLVLTYPVEIGRDTDEILRVIDSCQLAEQYQVSTPANWTKGEAVLVDVTLTNAEAEKKYGKDGCEVIPVQSEFGKTHPDQLTNYFRYTRDPSLSTTSGENNFLLPKIVPQTKKVVSSAKNKMSESLMINSKFPNIGGENDNESNSFDLYSYLGDSWGLIFTYTGYFTPVNVTELIEATILKQQFTKRGVKVCFVSCSDLVSHKKLAQDVEHLTLSKFDYPLLCDPLGTRIQELGIVSSDNMNMRSVYIVKPNKVIHLMMTYPLTTGFNFTEILRAMDGSQLTELYKVATPANWRKGQDVIVGYPLSNAQADTVFGRNGYRIVVLPSEKGKDLSKNYLRYTFDPSLTDSCGSDSTIETNTTTVSINKTSAMKFGTRMSKKLFGLFNK